MHRTKTDASKYVVGNGSKQEVDTVHKRKEKCFCRRFISDHPNFVKILILAVIAIMLAAVVVGVTVSRRSNQNVGSTQTNAQGSGCDYHCDNNNTCINNESLCNGLIDCKDSSDEIGEFCKTPTTPVCAFACDNTTCVTPDCVCDGEFDCLDQTDEINCTRRNKTEKLSPKPTCECSAISELHPRCFCDDTENCVGGRDEDNCVISKLGYGEDVQLFHAISRTYQHICADNWNSLKSQIACAYLGYTTSGNTALVTTSDSGIMTSLPLVDDWVNSPLQKCPSGKRVSLNCERVSECGKINTNLNQRVVGGKDSTIEARPWQASLRSGGSWQHICGAVVISEWDVLTAAHCVYSGGTTSDASLYRVGVGSSQINSRKMAQYQVSKITVHPLYDESTLNADIAILKLSTTLKLSSTVQPICLPTPKQEFPDHSTVVVSGWGLTQESGSTASRILQYVELNLMSYKECKKIYEDVNDLMICAGVDEGGKDACQGDSGGPLVATVNGKAVLVGLVSSGDGCARPGKPGIYTSVAEFVSWIKRRVQF